MIILGSENATRHTSLETALRELCEAILNDASVTAAREQVEAFLEDDEARGLYAAVAEKHDELHQKQHAGIQLTDADIEEFQSLRQRAFSDARVQQFTGARASLQDLEDRVAAFVQKTVELGRIPEEHEVVRQGGCCGGGGGGCGCH